MSFFSANRACWIGKRTLAFLIVFLLGLNARLFSQIEDMGEVGGGEPSEVLPFLDDPLLNSFDGCVEYDDAYGALIFDDITQTRVWAGADIATGMMSGFVESKDSGEIAYFELDTISGELLLVDGATGNTTNQNVNTAGNNPSSLGFVVAIVRAGPIVAKGTWVGGKWIGGKVIQGGRWVGGKIKGWWGSKPKVQSKTDEAAEAYIKKLTDRARKGKSHLDDSTDFDID